MAIRSSISFLFNNISSEDMGLWNVNVDTSGLSSETFFNSRTINEVKIRDRDEPYFQSVSESPLEFTVSFAFKDGFDTDSIRAVARWLFSKEYKPLQFSDNLDRIYYVIFQGNSDLLHNAGQGYITLNCRCSSPYSFSPTMLSQTFDLSSNPVGGTIISLDNRGDKSIFPEIYIEKVGNSEIEIINLSNSGISTKFSYLIPNPTVAPILSQVANGSSTLPAVKYYVRYTWIGTSGETNVSAEVSFTIVSSGFNLVVTIPSLPSGATNCMVYVGTATGSGTLQGVTSTTTFVKSTPLVAGATPPTSNSTGIQNGENLYIDNENEYIESDLIPVKYRFGNFNNNWLELLYGKNNLQIFGGCKIRFKYEYVYLQG